MRPASALLLATLAASAALACAPHPPPLSLGPERERASLTDGEVDAIATILRLEDHRAFDPDTFGRLAAFPAVEVRRRAVIAVGRIGGPDAAPFLIHVLDRDPSPAVRADAAFALGILGDSSAAVVGALRRAAPADRIPVRPEEGTVVVEVVGALGRLGSDGARAHVVDMLRRVQRADDPIARSIAAEALLTLWKFPTGQGRAVSALRFVDHPDPELRWRAALALVRLGVPEAAPRFLTLLDDPDSRVRSLAARGLASPTVDSADLATTVLPALATALGDPHPHVRVNALRAIATFGDRTPTDAILGRLRDGDPNVAVAAASSLASLGPRLATDAATTAADPSLPVAVRSAALTGLAGLDADAALPTVAAMARAGREERYAAARALAPLGWHHARPIAGDLAADADPRVAIAATEALSTLAADGDLPADHATEIRQLLLRLALAADPRQRTVAIRGVTPLLRTSDLSAILDVYERASADPDARPAAIAAVRALGGLRAAHPDAAGEFFARFAPAGDRWVRRAVADTLGQGWGAAPPAVSSDDAAFYRDMVRRYVVPALARGRRPEALIRTPHGEIRIELLGEEAPLTVHNFITLADAGFYDDGVWHRVVPNFVLQDGAPAGDPTGGPGWTLRDELNRVRYDRGMVGMALSGPDTGGSQWFITHSPQPHLDGGYTLFGRVVAGERAMDRVVQGDAVISVRVRP
jgi:cyclophilin family peptidyl-prolyl cis-trans isomerase/HEAT repeat protein